MELDGKMRGQLNEALRHAFPEPDDLKRMLDYSLDKKLNELTYGKNLINTIYDVIESALSEGWMRALIAAAYREKPNNPKLSAFVKQFPFISLSIDLPPQELVEKFIKNKTKPFLSAADWTNKSIKVLHQVCLIEFALRENKAGHEKIFGTGFLLGPDIVMTNYHVIEEVIEGKKRSAQGKPWAKPEDLILRFGYFEKYDNKRKDFVEDYSLAGEKWLISCSPPPPNGLDYALLHLAGGPGKQLIKHTAIDKPAIRGWIKPITSSREDYETGMPLPILQHPNGGPLMIDWGTIIGLRDKTYLQYTTNTEFGSSGAPCFNRNWEVIALHRAGGSTSQNYNVGVLFDAILKNLDQKGLTIGESELFFDEEVSHTTKTTVMKLTKEKRKGKKQEAISNSATPDEASQSNKDPKFAKRRMPSELALDEIASKEELIEQIDLLIIGLSSLDKHFGDIEDFVSLTAVKTTVAIIGKVDILFKEIDVSAEIDNLNVSKALEEADPILLKIKPKLQVLQKALPALKKDEEQSLKYSPQTEYLATAQQELHGYLSELKLQLERLRGELA